MYLKELQAYGFKSFADKTVIEFSNNINGIVGPNGSGKSNIVDAVRWVLGSASNKSLRAQASQDVIFSGSKSRKPLNSASVNLIFDNIDHALPIDYDEVSIKRVMYRSGENEYYLNGEKCRLKDVTDLLIDSGASRESFNIISQGKIDEILSTKPTDRRVIFEEAAGVLKYKKRKEEAIRKLERTNNNLNRVNDIIKELETNLEPLKEQSINAKKYLNVKEKLADIEISLMVSDIEKNNFLYNELKEKISSLQDEITKLNTSSTTYDIDLLKYKNKLKEVSDKLQSLREDELSLTKELENTSSDIKLLEERKKYKGESLSKIDDIKDNINEKNNKLNNIIKELEVYNHKLEISNKEYENSNNIYNNIKKENNSIIEQIDKYNREVSNIKYKIDYLEEEINNNSRMPLAIKSILNNPIFKGIHNTIANLITVSNEYSLALMTSLTSSSNYLVVDSKAVASRLVTYLKENKLGRATFYPLDTMKPRNVYEEDLIKIKDNPSFIGILNNLVEYDPIYTNVISNLIGNVLVVKDIDSANEISKILNNKYKIVTLDGQVVNVGGSITGGDKIKTNDTIEARHNLEEYKNKLNITLDNIKEKETILQKSNKELNDIVSKLTQLKINIDSIKEIIKTKLEEKNTSYDEIMLLTKELNDINVINKGTSDIERDNLMNKYYQIKNKITDTLKEIELCNIDKHKLEEDILELETISKNSLSNINIKEKHLHELELKSSKLEIRIDDLLNNLTNDYNMTYSNAKEKYILSIEEDIARKQVIEYKNIIKDIGIVNLGSIDEYNRINTRYEFLTNQKEDLTKAEDTLLEIIKDMDNIMKDKFLSTFTEIKEEFKKVFKELFKGGSANLYLTNPEDILETGIELEATPPGKNLRSIQALSGGEKTFTAIALLFAILNVRPVPFCLFDEVEAALDDNNVLTFSEYLSRYKDNTQFIIITHKKKTMEYVDTLYGITMQESGVSKLVSVKLEEKK